MIKVVRATYVVGVETDEVLAIHDCLIIYEESTFMFTKFNT